METPYSHTTESDENGQMNKVAMEELRRRFHLLYSSPKILVVDDDETDFEALANMFHQFGVQLFHAKTIDGAVEFLKNANFSLIMLDWKIPGSGGAEMLDFLNQTNNPIPVALYTGYMDSVILSEAAKKRTVALIAKPITYRQIEQLLKLFKLS